MAVQDWVTSTIAALALMLSLINFAKAQLEQKARVKVTITWPYDDAELKDLHNRKAAVKAINLSHRAIELNDIAGFILPNKEVVRISFGKGKSIEFEEPHTYEIGMTTFENAIRQAGYSGSVKVIGFCKDHRERQYKGKPLTFDPTRWERQKREDEEKIEEGVNYSV